MQWRDIVRVRGAVLSGMSEDEAESTRNHDRPLLVYVYDAEEDGARYDMEKNRTFFDEKVAIGARFFDCVRIASEDAEREGMFGEKIKRLPMVALVRPNYEVVAKMTGKLNAGKLFASMCTTMREDYENCVKTAVKKQGILMKKRAKLDKTRRKLAKIEDKIANEDSQNKRASLMKTRDGLEKKLGDAELEIDTAEGVLYDMKKKEADKA